MKIVLPNNHQAERQYAADMLFGTILRLPYETTFAEQTNTDILLENGRRITIEDHFFNHFPPPNTYLTTDAVPKTVNWLEKEHCPFLPENNLPVLFGTCRCEVSDDRVLLGCDVFAATFFCLTRWEEVVKLARDGHGRFPLSASLAGQHGYIERPNVDEMAALLRNALRHLGGPVSEAPNKFRFMVTHDVDFHFRWPDNLHFIKKMAGDVLKRRDFKETAINFGSFFDTKFLQKLDPYDTYDYLMDLSERHGLTSQFYFLAGGRTEFDNEMERRLPEAKPILEKINARGHKIGVHPSYRSADDEAIFNQEIERFRSLSPQTVTCGRQHFLRFDAGKTWRFWEKNGLEMDSTLGYPEQSGFRCGTCTPYPTFDIFERKKMRLMEMPLTAMDATYPGYLRATPAEMEADLLNLLATVKKYNGTFTFLWHNSSFQVPVYQSFAPIYERFLAAASTSS